MHSESERRNYAKCIKISNEECIKKKVVNPNSISRNGIMVFICGLMLVQC